MSKVELYEGVFADSKEIHLPRRIKKALKRSYLKEHGRDKVWRMRDLKIRGVSRTRGDRRMKPVNGYTISSSTLG